MEYFLTTSDKATPDVIEYARQLAETVGLEFLPRNRRSLKELRTYTTAGFFVLDQQRLLTYYGDPPFRFHPGMAHLRILALSRGERDRLIDLAKIEAGDVVLDCTAGLCGDAAVFSHVVGAFGEVIALESSFPVYLVTLTGLANYPFADSTDRQAFQRIKLYHQDYQDYLRTAEPESVDIVYFDPMFERPVTASSGIEPLRQIADYDRLEPSDIKQALDIARKCVVVKATAESSLWTAWPPDQLAESKGSRVVYGLYRK